ncbi:hypothetical protein ABZ804_21830 [Streptomyces sp. NPDC047726]|uniref:hypothetical protein n=1 Tax=unclassified Streptomyces TaxID=2593676 RepID=UPI0034028AE8
MATLLMGRRDWAGDLRITESHQVPDDDEATIERLVNGQDDASAWAATFDVDDHKAAVQRAYDEYVAADGDALVDEVHGFEPSTD